MRQLEDAKQLAQFVELYMKGKITEYSLEKELAKAAKTLVFNGASISVKISEEQSGVNHKPFVITTCPHIGQSSSSVKILIDKKLFELLSEKELVAAFVAEVFNGQDALKSCSSFVLNHGSEDVGVAEVIQMFLEIYKKSISTVKIQLPKVADKLSKARVCPTDEELAEAGEMLHNERLEVALEYILGKGILPLEFVDKAKELAKKIRDKYREIKDDGELFDANTPTTNKFQQERENLVDGRYNKIKNQSISHEYRGEGTQ